MSGKDNTQTFNLDQGGVTTAEPAATPKDANAMAGMGMTLEKLSEQQKKRPLTKWERKMNRIFGEAKHARQTFLQGFMMGGIVGGLMGGLTGTYFAFQYRQISFIPIAAISSGCSFGFFMGVGAVLRAEAAPRIAAEDNQY